MRALRFEKTGSLEGLAVQEIPRPNPGPGEVLVQVKAAAVNPSDIKNVLGKMHETTVPRTPGRDFAGIVVSGDGVQAGASVFGFGGSLGFGRDGTHAELVTVPKIVALPMPKGLTFEQAGAIGLPYITAWAALVKTAKLQPGETVLIIGATGAVGSAAVHIAHGLGARVLGTVRSASEISKAQGLPVDNWIKLDTTEIPAGTREATNGRGADVVFDLVGGPLFENCLGALARRGRQVAISSNPPRVSFNLVDFYHNDSRLLGLDTVKLSLEEIAYIMRELTPGFESGKYPPPNPQAFPLAEGPQVYQRINDGSLKGKAVLKP